MGFFYAKSHSVVQAGFKLKAVPPTQPLPSWCEPPCLALLLVLKDDANLFCLKASAKRKRKPQFLVKRLML